MRLISDDENHLKGTLYCGICHKVINPSEKVLQSKELFIPVCTSCLQRFAEDDIELMLNIFLAFGGYFGLFSTESFCLSKILNNLNQKRVGSEEIEQLNVKLLHNAILHGIDPKEFLHRLKNYIEK